MFANDRYSDRRRIRELEQAFLGQKLRQNGLLESQLLADEGDTMPRVRGSKVGDVAIVLVLNRKGQPRSGDYESKGQCHAQ